MMNYFLTEDDLKKALEEERHHLFTAIGRALWELEHKVGLLINVGIEERSPAKEIKKGDKKMSEKKIKALMERLWLVADKLDNEELVSIAKGLEEYVGKASSNLKKFNEELKGLIGRIKVLEEKRAD